MFQSNFSSYPFRAFILGGPQMVHPDSCIGDDPGCPTMIQPILNWKWPGEVYPRTQLWPEIMLSDLIDPILIDQKNATEIRLIMKDQMRTVIQAEGVL